MKAHPAQPDNLQDGEMLNILSTDIAVLAHTHDVIAAIQKPIQKRSRLAKDQIRRDLAGVIADLETIRLGLS